MNYPPERLRILVSDDQEFDRRIACADLHGVHDVVEVSSLAETLEALATATRDGRPFNVILQDLDMGDSRGRNTFDAVRAAAGQTPIVVYTGCADDVVRLGVLRDGGADDFLVKKPSTEPAHIRRALEFAAMRSKAARETRILSVAARKEADELEEAAEDADSTNDTTVMRALAGERRYQGVTLDYLDRIDQRLSNVESNAATLASATTTNRNEIIQLATRFGELPQGEKNKTYAVGGGLVAFLTVLLEVVKAVFF